MPEPLIVDRQCHSYNSAALSQTGDVGDAERIRLTSTVQAMRYCLLGTVDLLLKSGWSKRLKEL
jgi:hypothetical protein